MEGRGIADLQAQNQFSELSELRLSWRSSVFVYSKKLCDDFVYSGLNHGGGLKSADAECVTI
mgnify:CR=1 FL=1